MMKLTETISKKMQNALRKVYGYLYPLDEEIDKIVKRKMQNFSEKPATVVSLNGKDVEGFAISIGIHTTCEERVVYNNTECVSYRSDLLLLFVNEQMEQLVCESAICYETIDAQEFAIANVEYRPIALTDVDMQFYDILM
jgi:hypothetical protein